MRKRGGILFCNHNYNPTQTFVFFSKESMLDQLAYISTLEKCVQSFGPEAQLVSGNANRFIGESLVTFERISMGVVTGKFVTVESLANALRVPFLSILGWCHKSVSTGTRLRAREVLDMITSQIERKKPMSGLYLCREALDVIYFNKTELAERFAFNPSRYTENVVDGGWPGAPDLSLFTVQCKLETGEYTDVRAFAKELEQIGQKYLDGTEDQLCDPLCEYAKFITSVASGLINPLPTSSSSSAPSSSSSSSTTTSAKTMEAADAGGVSARQWRLFATDHGSPVWKLEWHGGSETDPYMLHIRRLVTDFENWVGDVPLCTAMTRATKYAKDEKGWMAAAKSVRGGTTLLAWNSHRRRAELLKNVVHHLCDNMNTESNETKLLQIHNALSKYEAPEMDTEMMSSMAYAWSCFLYFQKRKLVWKQQSVNAETVKRMRQMHHPVTSKTVVNDAIQMHVKDTIVMHNREFLRFWAQVPTYEAALAIAEFDDLCDSGDDEEDADIVDARLSEVFNGIRLAGDIYVSTSAVTEFTGNVNDVTALCKKLVSVCYNESEEFRQTMMGDLKHVYGDDPDMWPSVAVVGYLDQVEDIIALNRIRTLDPKRKKHMVVVAGKMIEMIFTPEKIKQAASIWRTVIEFIHETEWIRNSFDMANTMMEMQTERASMASASITPEGAETHAMQGLKFSDKLSRSASKILLHYRKSEPDVVTPLSDAEMMDLEQQWVGLGWSGFN